MGASARAVVPSTRGIWMSAELFCQLKLLPGSHCRFLHRNLCLTSSFRVDTPNPRKACAHASTATAISDRSKPSRDSFHRNHLHCKSRRHPYVSIHPLTKAIPRSSPRTRLKGLALNLASREAARFLSMLPSIARGFKARCHKQLARLL